MNASPRQAGQVEQRLGGMVRRIGRFSFRLTLLFALHLPMHAQAIHFSAAPQAQGSIFTPGVVADIDSNGWLETAGTLNDGSGNLLTWSTFMGLDLVINNGAVNDLRIADIDGDGCPDIVTQGYSSTTQDTRAQLYFNDGNQWFTASPVFANLNLVGRGEGLVISDFNNDGYLDIYLPYYTQQPCIPAEQCPNAPQSYLLLNDGHGNFREVATIAGVNFSASPGAQTEGAQAADVNNDGLIDLYAGGRLMINRYIDANGIPHFSDCQCGLPSPPDDGDVRADEGAKFLDWNNDGLLDLVLMDWDEGPVLYQNFGTETAPRFGAQKWSSMVEGVRGRVHMRRGSGTTTAQQKFVPIPFFSSGAPNFKALPFFDSYGLNVYDMDGDGWEDVIVDGTQAGAQAVCGLNGPSLCFFPNAIFRNTGRRFEQVDGGELTGLYGSGMVAFGDFNRDGKIDAIYSQPGSTAGYEFINDSPVANSFVSVELLGPNGERNQYGRVVRVKPEGTNWTYTRIVDGGSGYHSQNQYPLLIGSSAAGPFQVQAFFGGSAPVQFVMSAQQYAQVYAPSGAYPNGRVVLFSAPPPPLPIGCINWLQNSLDLLQ